MNRAVFFDTVRGPLFSGALITPQVQGMEAILDEAMRRRGVLLQWVAYILATAYHETGRRMQPISELGGDAYLSKYDTGRLAKALGNTPERDGDGQRYKGRGLVQLTGLANYIKASKLYGIDLVNDPERANELRLAVMIIYDGMLDGWFTGKKMADYITAERVDYDAARRVVNGLDKSGLIAAYARRFEAALIAARYEPAVQASVPRLHVEQSPSTIAPAVPQPLGFWGRVIAWLQSWRTA